jgi:hypothetical protein
VLVVNFVLKVNHAVKILVHKNKNKQRQQATTSISSISFSAFAI